jgi:pilus assembly protein CpaB
MSRRRRGTLLAGLALLLGGLAASDVAGREAALDRRLGPLVDVVVARTALSAGDRLTAARLAVRRVPARFAPRGGFGGPGDLVGQRVRADVPAGADLLAGALDAGHDDASGAPGAPVRRGERVADVVATGAAQGLQAGARVDVLVTREGHGGAPGRTSLALEDVELLGVRPAPSGPGQEGGPNVAASLRVTVRQAVYLAAAQSFAREIRLLPRAAGDRATTPGGLTYTEGL